MTPESLFKALSDPTRRAIFERLCREGQLSVHALTTGAGVSQPAVSKHLAQLRAAGLVLPEPQGRETFYRAEPQALAPLAAWLNDPAAYWDQRLTALGDLLKRMDQ
jgi:DNA-binding transcriptional ArsR family regulator